MTMETTSAQVSAHRRANGTSYRTARNILERQAHRLARIDTLRQSLDMPWEDHRTALKGILDLLEEMSQ